MHILIERMEFFKVIFSKRAHYDLYYLSEQIAHISKSRNLAKKYSDDLFLYVVDKLEFMPGAFAPSEYDYVKRWGKYCITFKNYTIIYNIYRDIVLVEHIMPSSMIISGF